MNTREFAKKHGIGTEWVRGRCNEGLIPLAEKKAGRWDIPEDAELPPCTGKTAAFIIESIFEREKGNEVSLYPASIARKADSAIPYLLRWNFIAAKKGGAGYTVLERGRRLMLRLRDTCVIERTAGVEGSIGVSVGPVSLEVGAKNGKKTV